MQASLLRRTDGGTVLYSYNCVRMNSLTSFPPALKDSARPRWSHRDPVEGGNPFKLHSQAHARWSHATGIAEDNLRRHDEHLNRRASNTKGLGEYQIELMSLAIIRFDTWAERGLAVVDSLNLCEEYATWLHTYTTNWVVYVADTCPHVAVNEELKTCLTIRTGHWTTVARSRLRHSAS